MRRSGQSLVPLLVALTIVIAALVYYGRKSATTAPNDVETKSAQRAGPPDIYPIASLTPGATNPAIAEGNIDQTICNPHWSTKSIRPPEEYTYRLKREQLAQYGDTDLKSSDYEEDHLIPLELGGSPTDPKNLWPEPLATSISDGGAKYKDKVESYLRQQVCDGAVPLAEAQRQIATDWYRVYVTAIR